MFIRPAYLLAFAFFLGAVCFGIAFAALTSEYSRFAEGTPLDATITKVGSIGVELRAIGTDGKEEKTSTHADANVLAGLKVGQTVRVLAPDGRAWNVVLEADLPNRKPHFGLLIGLAGCLGLTVVCATAPRRARKRAAARTSPLDLVRDVIARSRNRYFGMGLFLLAFGVFVAVMPFVDPESKGKVGMIVGLGILAALCLGVAGLLLRLGFQVLRPERSFVMVALTTNKQDLVAAYYTIFTTVKYGVRGERHVIDLRFRSGKKFQLDAGDADAPKLMGYIRQHLPHVSFENPETATGPKASPARG